MCMRMYVHVSIDTIRFKTFGIYVDPHWYPPSWNLHLEVLNFGVGSPEQLGCSNGVIFGAGEQEILGNRFFWRCTRLGSKRQEYIETIL